MMRLTVSRTSSARTFRNAGVRASAARDDTGPSLASWVPGPLEAVAFLPRLAAGAVVTAADKLELVQPRLQALANLAQDATLTASDKQVRSCSALCP